MNESAIVRQILDWLAAERIFAFRLNTSATKIGNRFFRAHGLGKGAADVLAIPEFNLPIEPLIKIVRPTWIECKNERGKQSPEQALFQQWVQSHGHLYILARSVDDVRELLESRR